MMNFVTFHVLCLWLLLGVGRIGHVLANRTIVLDDLDTRISWTPSVCPGSSTCSGKEWSLISPHIMGGGTVHSATSANLTMQFSFKGSAISWFTSTSSEDGTALVTVDSDSPVEVSTKTDSNILALGGTGPVFARQGLDPAKCHTITLKTTSNAQVDVDYFSIVVPDALDDTSASSGLADTACPIETKHHIPMQGAIIGGVVVGSILIILAATVLFVIRRRWKQCQQQVYHPSETSCETPTLGQLEYGVGSNALGFEGKDRMVRQGFYTQSTNSPMSTPNTDQTGFVRVDVQHPYPDPALLPPNFNYGPPSRSWTPTVYHPECLSPHNCAVHGPIMRGPDAADTNSIVNSLQHEEIDFPPPPYPRRRSSSSGAEVLPQHPVPIPASAPALVQGAEPS